MVQNYWRAVEEAESAAKHAKAAAEEPEQRAARAATELRVVRGEPDANPRPRRRGKR